MVVHCPEGPFRPEAPLPRAAGALVANGSPHWRISLQELPEVKESGLAYICAPFLGGSLQPKTRSYGGTTGPHASVGKNWGQNSPQDQFESLLRLCHTQPFSLPRPAPLTLQFSSCTLANRLWHTHLHPRFYFLGRLICDSLLECMLKMKKQKHKRLKCQNIEKTEKETNHTLPHCFSRVALGFYTRMSGNNTYFKKNVINHRILLFSETK